MDTKSFNSNRVSPKSVGILLEICTRNDLLLIDGMLAQAKEYLKNESAKGSNALAELIKELTDSRSAKINIILNVAFQAEKTPDLIHAIRQLLSTPSVKEGERGLFIPEIFGAGKIGWADNTYQLIQKNAKDFLKQISNEPSGMEHYQLHSLIYEGMEVPDISSARFSHIDIDNVYYLNSGSLVFKATIVRGRKSLSGLFSLNNRRIRTIVIQNGIISTTFTEQLFNGLKIQFLSFFEITGDSDDLWYDKSNNLIYLNIKIKSGWLSGYTGIYCWDGVCLKKVLSRDDEIQIDNQSYIIQSAKVYNLSHEGNIIICYKSSMPEIITGLAIYNNGKFDSLYKNQDIIGDNVKIDIRSSFSGEFGFFKEYSDFFIGGNSPQQISAINIFDDRIICLSGERTWDNEGDFCIIKLPEKKVEKIIRIKDDYPFTPKSHYISKIYSLIALNQEKVLISLSTMPKSIWKGDAMPRSHILLYDNGKYFQLNTTVFPLFFIIKHVEILPDGESILYNCSSLNETGGGGNEVYLFLLHEKKITNLLDELRIASIDNIKFISNPLNGAIIKGKRSIYKKDLGFVSEDEFSYWFLKFDHLKELIPVPEISISSEQSIPLNEILVWKNNKEAIVVKKEGIILLTDEYAES